MNYIRQCDWANIFRLKESEQNIYKQPWAFNNVCVSECVYSLFTKDSECMLIGHGALCIVSMELFYFFRLLFDRSKLIIIAMCAHKLKFTGRSRSASSCARVSIICTKQDNKKPASTKTNQEKDTWIRWFWNWMCLRTTRIAPCALTMYRMKYSFWNLFSDCKSNTKKTWCLLRPSYVNTDNSLQTQRLAYQSFNLKCSFPKSIPYFLGDT